MQIVLMYHDIYNHDPMESGFCRDRDMPYKMNSEKFENQVRCISEYLTKNNIKKESIVFTFDDGGKSFYTIIAPILEKFGFKGLFFISTNFIGKKTFLTVEEIKELNLRGHIIGSHAHTHEHLYTLSESQVYSEWEISIRILSNILRKKIECASIPNGDISNKGLEIMNSLGIKYIYTSVPTSNIKSYRNSCIIGRYVVLGDTTPDGVLRIVSSKSVRLSFIIKYHLINIIKRMLGSRYVQIKNAFLKY